MKYDLGQKDDFPGCCAPVGCSSDDKDKIRYPSLYFTGDTKMDIPDEGVATITFRKIDSGENTRDPDDPKYRCEIEVHSIEVKGGGKRDGLEVNVGSMLKDAMRKKMKKGEYEEEG